MNNQRTVTYKRTLFTITLPPLDDDDNTFMFWCGNKENNPSAQGWLQDIWLASLYDTQRQDRLVIKMLKETDLIITPVISTLERVER